MAFGLERIDWARPWFAGWRGLGSFASELVDGQGSVCSALNAVSEFAKGAQGSGGAVEFISQGELPADIAYEAFIYSHKRVPTRDNLHDFFNGLCWLRFPKTKSRLNFLQAQEINTQGVGSTRGPLRDALTLFDENVLLLQSSDALWQSL